MKRKVKITGTGMSLPKTCVTSSELEHRLNLKPGSIAHKVGVLTRYFVNEETGVDLAIHAVHQALDDAGIKANALDAVISAGASFFQPLPCNAALLHNHLNLAPHTIAFDVDSTCLSFLTAFDLASYAIEAGRFKNVAIISAEFPSIALNWQDEETATLFGDGATAVIVSAANDNNAHILSSHTETYSEGFDFCQIQGGGMNFPPWHFDGSNRDRFCFQMDGPKIFRVASKHFLGFINTLLQPIKYTTSDLDMVIPHQASLLAIKLLQKKIDVSDDRIMITLPKYGNTVAASIPMALHEAITTNRIRRGDKLMLVGTSAGLSIGGMVLEY